MEDSQLSEIIQLNNSISDLSDIQNNSYYNKDFHIGFNLYENNSSRCESLKSSKIDSKSESFLEQPIPLKKDSLNNLQNTSLNKNNKEKKTTNKEIKHRSSEKPPQPSASEENPDYIIKNTDLSQEKNPKEILERITASPIQTIKNDKLIEAHVKFFDFDDTENNKFKIIFPPSKKNVNRCVSFPLKNSFKINTNVIKEQSNLSINPSDSKSLFLKKAKDQIINQYNIEVKQKAMNGVSKDEINKSHNKISKLEFDAFKFEKNQLGTIFER